MHQQTWQFRSECKEQNVHLMANSWRFSAHSLFCYWGYTVSPPRRDGVCLNWALLSGFSRGYFGHQRKLGRRNDNPDIQAFGYNNNAIRIQRQVSCLSGNTRGRKDRTRAWEQVTDDPIPCKKKKWSDIEQYSDYYVIIYFIYDFLSETSSYTIPILKEFKLHIWLNILFNVLSVTIWEVIQ